MAAADMSDESFEWVAKNTVPIDTSTDLTVPTNTSTIRILTCNIFMRPPLVRNNASDYKEARLAYFINHVLPKFDIICLQEMFNFGSSRRNRLLEAAFKAGFKFSWASPEKRLVTGSIDGGLVLLSRFPLRERNSIVYPVGCHSDRFSDKGALYVKVAITQKTFIHLFLTHTQASYGSAPSLTEPSVIIRHKQIALLRKFIDNCTESANRKPEELIILVGDMNVNGRPQFDPSNPSVVEGDSPEYKCMTRILRGEGIEGNIANPKSGASNEMYYAASNVITIRDLLKERYGHHPVTFGDVFVDANGYVQPRETVLTAKYDWQTTASLDYIFLIDEKNDKALTHKKLVEIDLQQTKIEEFFISDDEKCPFTQLSDHYGVSTVLKIKPESGVVPYAF